MTANADPTATCTICAGPLAGGKSVTDSKGRPVCASCVDRARKARMAAAAPPKSASAAVKLPSTFDLEEDNAFLLELGGKAQALSGGKACPQCELVANQKDRVCLSCGYDFESGKKLRTKVDKAPKAKQGGGAPGAGGKIAMAIVALAAAGAAAWYFLHGQA